MKKHAYLIIAHNEMQMLQKLVQELDNELNDIYIHIDKKTAKFDESLIRECVKYSGVYFVPRINVRWGHISQVKCELILLKEATKREHYHYYHLISGADFPLKSQEEIHNLLENEDREFISFHKDGEYGDEFMYKIKYYHMLLRYVGRGIFDGNGRKARFMRKLGAWEYELVEWQKRKGIDRTRRYPEFTFYKGAQWFSITDAFARYVITKEKEINKMFRITNGPDEFVMPTLAINSKYKDKVAGCTLRRIDWNRGNPYEFVNDDLDELINCQELFARKISYNNSTKLVEELINNNSKEYSNITDKRLISVIVPVYNVQDYLPQCLDSISNQTYGNIEVIIVNDGSTDESGAIAKAYCDKDDRFTYIAQKNQGLSAARNTGIDNAKGEYLAFVDSDDWLGEDYLEKLYNAIIMQNSDMAVCGFVVEDGSDSTSSKNFDTSMLYSKEAAMKCLSNIFQKEDLLMVVAWNKLYRKELFKNIRYPVGKIHEDEFIAHRLIDASENIIAVDDALYHYRVRDNSITSGQTAQKLNHLDILEAQRDRVECCDKCMYNSVFVNIVYSFFETVTECIVRYSEESYKAMPVRRTIFKNSIGVLLKWGRVLPRKYRLECWYKLFFTRKYKKYIENFRGNI